MKLPKINAGQILPYATIGVGLYLFYKFFLKKTETEKAQQQSQQDVTTYVQQSTSGQTASTTPTKTRGEWALIADTIYEDLKYSRVSDNHGDAIYQLARPKNDADVALLIDTFGTRQEYFFGVPTTEGTLPVFVNSNLSNNERNIINDNYKRKNIKFRF